MIMSPADIVLKRNNLMMSDNSDQYSRDGLDCCLLHLEYLLRSIVPDISSVEPVMDGFKIEYKGSVSGAYFLLIGTGFKSIKGDDTRKAEARIICAYLNYLSNHDTSNPF